MKHTYIKVFYGTHEAVEAAVRKFDKVFRQVYNVYGGRREYSGKADEGEYMVAMSYTTYGRNAELTIQAINRRFYDEVDRMSIRNDFYCDTIKKKN